MVAKFLTFFALVAAATAVAIPVAAPAKVVYAEPEAPAQYDFSYSVHDSQSGDVKQQQESRAGDAVHGSYSLVQPDGVHRIVEYTSDAHNGFNAIVRYEGTPVQTAPAKIAVAAAPVAKIAYAPAPVVHAAPVAKIAYAPAPVVHAAPVTKVAYAPAPVVHAAPVAKIAYAAPVAKVAYAPAPVSYAAAPAHVSYAHAPAPAITYAQAPAPLTYSHAPVAKVAYTAAPVAKVAYAENLGHVTFSSPAVSYHH